MIIKYILGADDAADARYFQTALLNFIRVAIGVELSCLIEVWGIGVETESFHRDNNSAAAFVERIRGGFGEELLPGKVALLLQIPAIKGLRIDMAGGKELAAYVVVGKLLVDAVQRKFRAGFRA